ncbi:MAG: heparinase II/III family protein [Pseudomonadota bacterium]
MSLSSAADQLMLARLRAGRTARGIASGIGRSFGVRPEVIGSDRDTIRLSPSDIHPGDPSFFTQAKQGLVTLSGQTANLCAGGLFDNPPNGSEFLAAAHGFIWLKDLRASEAGEADDLMRQWTIDWLGGADRSDPIARNPKVMTRRILSWLSHADILLQDVDADVYDAFMDRLISDLTDLAGRWRKIADPGDRVQTLITLLAGGAALSSCHLIADTVRPSAESAFAELIRADGSHVTRNPALLVDILLDVLPIASACEALGSPLPETISDRSQNALQHIREMRHPDGSLARFNGVGSTPRAELGRLVLVGCTTENQHDAVSIHGDYLRFDAADTTMIADIGPCPPIEHAANAHAGCLSFELSSTSKPVIVNLGAPPLASTPDVLVARARATASHSTLALGGRSSARLQRSDSMAQLIGGQPIHGIKEVHHEVSEKPDELHLVASHNGYEPVFGVRHTRELTLSRDGKTLTGKDLITSANRTMRFASDIPFAIHFHVFPRNTCTREAHADAAVITLPDGEIWRLSCTDAQLCLEESVYFADTTGQTRCQQIVLRGASFGETTVAWQLCKLR